MSYIEKVFRKVEKNGIGGIQKIGNFSVESIYTKKGVKYTLIKNDLFIAVINRDNCNKTISINQIEKITIGDLKKLIPALFNVFPEFNILDILGNEY